MNKRHRWRRGLSTEQKRHHCGSASSAKTGKELAPVFSVARKQFSANDYLILLMTFVRQALGIALQSTCSLSLWCQQPGASRSASKILFPAKFRLLTLTHTCFFLSLLHTPILPYGPGGKLCFLKAFWF